MATVATITTFTNLGTKLHYRGYTRLRYAEQYVQRCKESKVFAIRHIHCDTNRTPDRVTGSQEIVDWFFYDEREDTYIHIRQQ